LYWNFGLAGVVGGMLLVGAAIGRLWALAGADPRGGVLNMLLYVHLMFGMPNMSDFVTVVVSLVASYLVFKTSMTIAQARSHTRGFHAQPAQL
jgi:hypothetical protein